MAQLLLLLLSHNYHEPCCTLAGADLDINISLNYAGALWVAG